jgi:hypothetical protein
VVLAYVAREETIAAEASADVWALGVRYYIFAFDSCHDLNVPSADFKACLIPPSMQ